MLEPPFHKDSIILMNLAVYVTFIYCSNSLHIQVYYRLMGDAVRVDCEGMGAKMVKLPKMDKIMTDDQFQEILLQDVEGLGEDGKTSWILILGSAVSYWISVTVSPVYTNNHINTPKWPIFVYFIHLPCLLYIYSLRMFVENWLNNSVIFRGLNY